MLLKSSFFLAFFGLVYLDLYEFSLESAFAEWLWLPTFLLPPWTEVTKQSESLEEERLSSPESCDG